MQSFAHIQPARCTPRDQRDRAPALHPARAHVGACGRGKLRRATREIARSEGGGVISDTKPLLIEIGTEELPPKALDELAAAFARGVCDGLAKRGITADAA